MNNQHIQLRLDVGLKTNWQNSVPEKCMSKIIRVFMRKALSALTKGHKDGGRLIRLLSGDYEINFRPSVEEKTTYEGE